MVPVVRRPHSFLWSLQVGVGIHSSRDHQVTISVHCLHTSWDNEVLPDLSAQVTRQETMSEEELQKKTKKKLNERGRAPECVPDDPILHKDISVE